ncbi:MAG: FixH family protein [Propionivibrio sp.]
MNSKLLPALPWYRHRWPWLLMLGPFTVIVAGVITLWLALRSNDGLVADDYYKQGLAINEVTSRDRRAAELELRGEVSLDTERQLVRVALNRGKLAEMPGILVLKLSHPTRGGLDQSFRLQRDNSGGYSAGLTGIPTGRWYLSLEDEAREWRLSASWDPSQHPAFALTPAPK